MLVSCIKEYKWSNTYIKVNRITYNTLDFILLIVEYKTQKALASYLGCSVSTIKSNLTKYLPELSDSTKKPLEYKVYSLLNLGFCSGCSSLHLKEAFHSNSFYCKECHKSYYIKNRKQRLDYSNSYNKRSEVIERKKHYNREYAVSNKEKFREKSAKRRAALLQRTPAWADVKKIKEIYYNCPEGYEVDHIIPLQGVYVCGLHIETNLQYLTPLENRQKSNKYDNITKTKMD
jgi:DNA-directed RNA polymerase subunit M/transcription elongation factor TFIIS